MSLAEYARRLTRLRTDVNAAHYPGQPGHRAPHKPLLLLSVMDLVAEDTLTPNLVEPTPDLAELFALYWSKVMPADRRESLALSESSRGSCAPAPLGSAMPSTQRFRRRAGSNSPTTRHTPWRLLR